jgi:molybdopterin converting factor small subunit
VVDGGDGAMTVEIRTYGSVRETVGKKRVEWDVDPETTVETVLSEFAKEYGLDESDVLVMKNGTHATYLEGEATPVEEGDSLSFS